MSSISSIGIGSGFLTSDLIDQLVQVERDAVEPRLDYNQAELEAQLSSVGRIKSAVQELRLPARILTTEGAMTSTTGKSSDSGISVETDRGASPGSYNVSVEQLAQAQSIVSGSYTDKTSEVGEGVLTIQFGSFTYTDANATSGDGPGGVDEENLDTFTADGEKDPISIIVDSSNNTLEGIRDAINEEDAGIEASILNDGSGYRLVLRSTETGEESAFSVTASGDSDGDSNDANGLSALNFNTTDQNTTESIRAQDAEMTLNGIPVTRNSNEVTELIDGVTLNLSNTTTSSTITIERDEETIVGRIESFVEAYNNLQSIIKEETAFDSETNTGAVLLGDNMVRSLSSQLRSDIGNIIPGLEDSAVRSLAEIGFSTGDNAQMEFDSEVFLDALEDYPDEVEAIFGRSLVSDNTDVEFVTMGNAEPGSYDVNVTQLATNGSFTGSTVGAPTNIVVDGTNDEFVIEVDGVTSGTISLTQQTYADLDALAEEMQNLINADSALSGSGTSVTVTVDSNQLVFTSDAFGSSSNVNFSSVEDGSLYGLAAGSGTAGVDVEGTINGAVATGSGQLLSLSDDDNDADGVAVLITATSFPSGSSSLTSEITVADGVAQSLIESFNDMLSFEGLISNKINSLNEQLETVDQQRTDLDERLLNFQQRLETQFIAADLRVSQLQNTEDFVRTQLSAIVNSFTGGSSE
jgi:flagellar hook-associated protein 2